VRGAHTALRFSAPSASDGHTGTHQRQFSHGAKRAERHHDAEPGAGWHPIGTENLRGEDVWAAWAIPACFRDGRLQSRTRRWAEPTSGCGVVGHYCRRRCSRYCWPRGQFHWPGPQTDSAHTASDPSRQRSMRLGCASERRAAMSAERGVWRCVCVVCVVCGLMVIRSLNVGSGFGGPPKPTGQRPVLPMAIGPQAQTGALCCARHGCSVQPCSRLGFSVFWAFESVSDLGFAASDLADQNIAPRWVTGAWVNRPQRHQERRDGGTRYSLAFSAFFSGSKDAMVAGQFSAAGPHGALGGDGDRFGCAGAWQSREAGGASQGRLRFGAVMACAVWSHRRGSPTGQLDAPADGALAVWASWACGSAGGQAGRSVSVESSPSSAWLNWWQGSSF
jgi:hypothetical protein